MRKNKIIAFALVVLMCTTVFAPSLAGAIDLSWDYNIFYNGGYIMGIPECVSPEKFEWSMKEKTEVSTTQDHIGTGSSVKIADKSYEAVVLGDVNGDGVVDTTDYVIIKKHCLGNYELNGAFLEAADVDGDRPVDATDYLRIKGHFLEMFNLYEGSYLKAPDSFGLDGVSNVVNEAGFVNPFEVECEQEANPALRHADPYVTYHEGKYYIPFTAWGNLYISSFNTLEEMTTDNATNISLDIISDDCARSNIWPPKMFFVDGYWYFYYSASDDNAANRRIYVLKSKTSDALGEYEYMGKVADINDKWANAGSLFKYKGDLYFTWSGWKGDKNDAQNIYIAKMESPTKISGERVLISEPELDWETKGGLPYINDAPCVITSDEYLTILYSASGSWTDDYCIGQLIYLGGDVLKKENWYKFNSPVLSTQGDSNMYGPGNCCVTTDENGVMWMIFHASTAENQGGANRATWKYPIRIKKDIPMNDFRGEVNGKVDIIQPMNPVRIGAADPHITYHDGKYYWIGFWGGFHVIEFDELDLENIEDLKDNNLFTYEKVKFISIEMEGLDTTGEVWAPELHFIDGYWYIYFAYLSPGADASMRRMYVSKGQFVPDENGGIKGKFGTPVKLAPTDDKWAIDGSVFEYEGQMYFIWSGWPGNDNVQQNIYIAEMSDPMTISSDRVLISEPDQDWERQKGAMPENPYVNEGPVAIVKDEYLTIVYSASGSWCDDYCLGQLVFKGGNVLDKSNWTKYYQPILASNGIFYGPGHNCVLTDEYGNMWMVFHAKLKPTKYYTDKGGTAWDGRHTFMLPMKFNEHGIVEVVVS